MAIDTADRIAHGTLKGWRQHRRRLSPMCEPCRDAKRADDQRRFEEREERPGRDDALAWNGGATGTSRPADRISVTHDACTVPDCDTEAANQLLPDGWQAVTIAGVRRRYCSSWCAIYAEALHDIRSIPTRKAA